MTSCSYAANFNRIRLLEMIDYREPQTSRREMQRLSATYTLEQEIRAFSELQLGICAKHDRASLGIIP